MRTFILFLAVSFLLFSCDDSSNDNNDNNINNSANNVNNSANNVNNSANNNNNTVNNTTTTSDVWSPSAGTTWQWQLSGYPVNTTFDFEMFDIDLFDVDQGTIDDLHQRGRVVICYFSAGSFEDWRPDAGDYAPQDYGNALDEWPGEYWVDTRSENVRAIIRARMDLAVERGCDGVEPDNVDGYQNDPGFPLDYQTQLDFNLFLSEEAHQRGLSVGLKNDGDQVPDLLAHFDWALNEECVAYDECALYRSFIQSDKPVFHVEYIDATSEASAVVADVCDDPQRAGFSTLIKLWDLTAWYFDCANDPR